VETAALLVAALPLLDPVHGLTSTLVSDVILAFFLEGAVTAAVVFIVLGFNAWCFRFLTSEIVFDGNMSAI